MLTPVETFWLGWHVDHGQRATARKAAAILRAEAGLEPADIAAELKLTPAGLARTLAQFQQKRLGLFPRPALFVDELLEAARVDMGHARQVADHALRLFDETRSIHRLSARMRELLETAALLHNVGLEVDAPRHHTAGRDLLAAVSLVGHSAAEHKLLACAVRFHRKAVRPDKEPFFAELNARQKQQALALSALLRIADGLDYSQSQTTRLEAVAAAPETLTLTLAGPQADGDGERAVEKADLWTEVFGSAVAVAAAPIDLDQLAHMPLTAETPMPVVVVRALADQLTRWQAAEAEVRAGAPPAIKALRAAARRSRAALELFRSYFKKKAVKRLSRQLKDAEDALSEVRDWDVLIAEAEGAAHGQTWAFLEGWKLARQAALARGLRWLDGGEAGRLRAALAEFIAGPPTRRKRAHAALAAEAGALLEERLDSLRDYAAALDERDLTTFHDLRRVAVKRCRFTLEFFAPAFGEPAEALLKQIVKTQDRLGYLNDACVAREKLTAWLAAHPEDSDAFRYLQLCNAQVQKHLRKFKRDWGLIAPETLRRKIQALLERLQPDESEPQAAGDV